MVLRLIGTATTDNNGVAVLSNGYTGTGAGMVDFVASAEIDGGSVVSEPYSVWDCIYYEDGTKLSTWKYNTNQITASQSNGETTFSTTDTSDRTANINDPSTFTAPYVVEFKVVSLTGSGGIINWASGQNGNRSFFALGITTGSSVKMEVSETVIKFYVDGQYVSGQDRTVTATNPYTSVGLSINNGSVTFKDYKVYKG